MPEIDPEKTDADNVKGSSFKAFVYRDDKGHITLSGIDTIEELMLLIGSLFKELTEEICERLNFIGEEK